MMLKIGQLNRRITLMTRDTTLSIYGEPLDSWIAGTTLWANIKPLTGRELFQASQVHTEVTSKITVRYSASVKIVPSMRIQYGTRTFEVQSATNVDEANKFIEMLCMEVVD